MKRAGIIVKKAYGRLAPVSAFDDESLDAFPDGSEFDLISRKRRSTSQNRLYWQILTGIVAATDRWATAAHLHDALLRDLGYEHVVTGLDGCPYITRNSTAFAEMLAPEFQVYMDKALARLAEVLGFDPMDTIAARAA